MRPDAERHGALVMTEAARPILRGEASINLRRDSLEAANERRPQVRTLVSDEDAPLLSALKAKRRALAEEQSVPAYVIFPDKTLIEMVESRPKTLDDMARINGVGAKKLERYGRAFLEVMAGDVPDTHPARRKLAVSDAGGIYDALLASQAQLVRGACGTMKPMSCNAGQLAKIAQSKPRDETGIARIIGDRHAERFAETFLDVLRAAD
jgi:ATP-dependent DNA helicase RecQ